MQDLNPLDSKSSLSQSLISSNWVTEKSKEFKIQYFLAILNRRWWIILGVSLAVFSYQMKIDLKRPPIYQQEFQLLVQPPEQDITNPLEGAGQILANADKGDYFATQIAILLSNKLLNPVLKEIYKQYPELSNNFTFEDLVSRIKINQINKGQVLSISYQDNDPKRVKFVLDQLAKSYLNYTLQEQKIKTQQKLGFINRQLPIVQKRVNILQQELLKLQKNYNFFDPQAQGQLLDSSLNAILQKRQDVEIQIQQNKIMAEQLRQQIGLTDSQAIALNALSQSPQYSQLLGRINEINMQLAKESTRLTDDNIIIQQLKQERANLIPLINQQALGVLKFQPNNVAKFAPLVLAPNDIRSDSLKKVLEINTQLASLEKQKQLLSLYENQTRQNLKNFSQVVTQYNNIQRQLNLEMESLNRLSAAEQTLEIEISKTFIPWRLVSEPRLPNQPVDRFINNLLLALIKGLVIGGLVGGLVEILDRRYYSPDDITQDTGAPILGIIPLIPALKILHKKKGKQVLKTNFIEAFSVLFSSIFFLQQKKQCRSLIVTSPTSGDGKSTIAFFTALAAAKLGQRVLLIDGDRYFPQEQRWLKIISLLDDKNINKNLNNKDNFSKLISATDEPVPLMNNFDYFKTQDNALAPDQLMSSQSLLTLLNQWQEYYDVILIDTPPILGLSDSRLIASQTDGVLLVVRLGKTNKDHILSVLDSLKFADLNLLGIVVNGVSKHSVGYDYYNYNYYNRYYRKKLEENI